MEALNSIDAIVLAAGRSSRMGTPKAQLEIESGTTFLERCVKVLRDAGCRYVIAVVSAEDDWAARLADVAGAAVVINDLQGSQQIDSLRLGLAHLPEDCTGVVVLPVDMPKVAVATIQKLMTAFSEGQAPVVVPQYDGRNGHPVIFRREIFGELLADPLPRGAESVVEAHQDRAEIAVEDASILIDIDKPGDYERARGR